MIFLYLEWRILSNSQLGGVWVIPATAIALLSIYLLIEKLIKW
jgi:hypothetical protein